MMPFFEKLILAYFNIFIYPVYRRRFSLPSCFRFNGYFIRFHGGGNVDVGADCYISFFSYVNVCEGTDLKIGDNVSIGHNVKIYTSSFDAEQLIQDGKKKSSRKNVKIGSNVLIGSNVFINPGVEIGSNVVVGANSVVSKDLPANCVAVGSPARPVKYVEVHEG